MRRDKYAYAGYFQGHYLRSFSEFMVALQLIYLERKAFRTEGLRLQSPIDQGSKIPDFLEILNAA